MRRGGLASDVGVADLPHQYGLAEFEGALAERDQPPPVGDAFHEHDDRFVFFLLEEKFHQVEHRRIGFIAGRDRIVEADAVIGRGGDNAETEAAGLRDHRGRTGNQRSQLHGPAKADARVVFQIQHAEAIGADDAHAAAFGGGSELLLQRDAFAAHFAEARRQHDGERDAGSAALLDYAEDMLRRERHECDVAGLGHRSDIFIAGESLDFGIFRIDRIDLALETEFGEEL